MGVRREPDHITDRHQGPAAGDRVACTGLQLLQGDGHDHRRRSTSALISEPEGQTFYSSTPGGSSKSSILQSQR
jgi:hypothetical protein